MPGPTIWPVGFAVGIVCILAGLVVSMPAVIAGVVITVVFGFLWVREATREYRGERAPLDPVGSQEPEPASVPAAPPRPAAEGEAAMPLMSDAEVERYPRSKFLELATLGLGGVIGGIVTVPSLGFMVLPGFTEDEPEEVDLGPLENFPEGSFVVSTFMLDPSEGEVTRRTAYIRNNGLLEGQPSFTIISNRCAHLGCPVQPNGLLDEKKRTEVPTDAPSGGKTKVLITPVDPSGFGCPCHGGQYDTEGNRRAGPPVRALDRYHYSIRNGRLHLGKPYSVGEVEGTGKEAVIKSYELTGPGQHVDGLEAWLYPIQPPR
ncbi:MAG: ubiquinol-cytochrome c reductase iron-sulfur subunit [Gaiellaceae bacterium]